MTAAHVLMDPFETGVSKINHVDGTAYTDGKIYMGIMVQVPPAYIAASRPGPKDPEYLVMPIQQSFTWGKWEQGPLLNSPETYKYKTDVGICKVKPLPWGLPYQPLALSSNPFTVGERAFALGYSEMNDIELIDNGNGGKKPREMRAELFVSGGPVLNLYRNNHVTREVPTPGPCFDFEARIPGKMSGSPIFGAGGVVVRGVVSRSFSGEKHAFGVAVDSILDLPLGAGETLRKMQVSGLEGMPQVMGSGL